MPGVEPANPYSTRSQNSSSAPRPNYAEDQLLDTEPELEVLQVPSRDVALRTDSIHGSLSLETLSPSTAPNTHSGRHEHPKPPSTSEPVAIESVDRSGSYERAETLPKKRRASAQFLTMNTLIRAPGFSSTTPRINRSTYTNVVFASNAATLKSGKLQADENITYALNDQVYLVCEPAGEPYYLARIMEFIHRDNIPTNPVIAIRVNWFYRPRDIQRPLTDSRQVYATMHSDKCPLSSIRGKCYVAHRSEISDFNQYRKSKDSFWYDKLFDKYIHRFYEVIPTAAVINVPNPVKKVLDARWKFIVAEASRAKELTSDVKTCRRCSTYAASHESVECAVCRWTYHMSCIDPPLLKKPTRGFAWSCGSCSRAQERRLEARSNPQIDGDNNEDEEQLDGDHHPQLDTEELLQNLSSSKHESMDSRPGADQGLRSRSWPYRYLGIHCKVEDALDSDDRIYPRAGTRLGPKHQAVVLPWPGRPIEYIRSTESKKRYGKTNILKKDQRFSKEVNSSHESDRSSREVRPAWVVDQPQGFIFRGFDLSADDPDATTRLIFDGNSDEVPDTPVQGVCSSPSAKTDAMDRFLDRARQIAAVMNLHQCSTDFTTKALELLQHHRFDVELALQALRSVDVNLDLQIPNFNSEQLSAFEEGVLRYGSELQSVTKHVNGSISSDLRVSHSSVVRFYYVWKKTPAGREIWGNHAGRKGKKEGRKAEETTAKLIDDLADDLDDSAYDNDKAAIRRCKFQCRFCHVRQSRLWRRAPGFALSSQTIPVRPTGSPPKEKDQNLVSALCLRCASLWRRYGIHYEDIDEVAKRVSQAGGRAARRRVDEELLQELMAANAAVGMIPSQLTLDAADAAGLVVPEITHEVVEEASASIKKPKRLRSGLIASNSAATSESEAVPAPSVKKKPEKPPSQPLVIEFPKPKSMPCAVCQYPATTASPTVVCKDCRMTVHDTCYGVARERAFSKWVCDTCMNDRNLQTTTIYKCVLCPVDTRLHDFVVSPRPSTKKKTERDRERERLEKSAAEQSAAFYEQKQIDAHKPIMPREALKRTVGNNWVHVQCAIWTQGTRFHDAIRLDVVEGISAIPMQRYEQTCWVCESHQGACVECQHCSATVHVSCAQQADFELGFELLAIKASKKDGSQLVNIGQETGMLQAVIRCSEHLKKSPIRAANDMVEEQNTTMIQLYVTHYKQAEHGASETMRQASFVLDISKPALGSTGSRRHGLRSASPVRQSNGTAITARSSSKGSSSSRLDPPPTCSKCGTGVTPRWWSDNIRKSMDHAGTKDISVVPETHQTSYSDDRLSRPLENGYAEISMGRDNGSLTEQRLLCHKCHWIQNQENGSLAVTTAPSMQKIRSSDTTVEHTITSGPLPNASDSRFGMVRGAGESMGSGVIIPSYYDPAPVMPVRDSGPLMVGISNAQRNAPSLDPPRPIGYPGPYVPDLRHRPMMRTDQAPGLNGAIPLPPPTMRSPIRPYAIPPMFLPFEADGPRPASSFNHILSPPPQGPVSRTNYEIHQPLPAVHVRNHSGGASASPSLANLVN